MLLIERVTNRWNVEDGRHWKAGVLMVAPAVEGGIEVTDADLVVGTSAGAIVGVQITSGLSLEGLY
jgi:NTE family protein